MLLQGCTGLTNITIPDSVTSIGSDAFYYCDSLTSVTFDDTSTWYYSRGDTEIDVTDTAQNATYLNHDYTDGYWYKE